MCRHLCKAENIEKDIKNQCKSAGTELGQRYLILQMNDMLTRDTGNLTPTLGEPKKLY